MSEIKNFYAGKNVLVTGATGFIGKVLVERLLRDCDDVNTIYLIIRGKNNFDKRCQEFLNHFVFDQVRESKPIQLGKIKIFQGDLAQENLGLNFNNLTEILNNINIVLHSGADVRFDVPLRNIFTTNTIGTYRVFELAKQIKKLDVFVFVSTAYSQSHQLITEERYYNGEMDPFYLMKAFDRFDEDTMTALQPKILKEFPNTYSFSKHLSEDIAYRYRNEFPICVVRPSVVCPAIRYPMRDYTEGFNGLNGWYFAALRGVLRTTHVNSKASLQTIPVDIVANAIIVASWVHGSKKVKHIEYYTTTTAEENLTTISEDYVLGKKLHSEIPLNYSIWSPNNLPTNCVYYYAIRTFFYQILPSILLDLLIRMFNHKPIMLKIQRKIYYGLLQTSKPYVKIIHFKTDNFKNIGKYLNSVDKQIFNTDISGLTTELLVGIYLRAIRKFIAKEKDEDLPRARRNNLIWYWIHAGMKFLVLIYLSKLIFERILSVLN